MKYSAQTDASGLIIAVCFGSLIREDLIEINKDQYDIVRAGGEYKLTSGELIAQPAPLENTDVIKRLVWDGIRSERDRRQLDGGVKVGDHWFLSSERAVSEYNTIVATMSGIPATTVVRKDWRTMDGATVDMTPALALQILKTGIQQRYAIDDAALAHKAAMEVNADPTAYDFSARWPQIFGEE